jgi:hypothetical protein
VYCKGIFRCWDPLIIEKVQRRAWGFWTAVCLIEVNYCQAVDRDIYSRPPLASKLAVAFCHDSLSLQPASSAASSLALNHTHLSGIRPSHIHTLQTSKQLSHVADSVLRVVELLLCASHPNQQRCALPPSCDIPYLRANNSDSQEPPAYRPLLTVKEEDKDTSLNLS